MKTLCLLDGGNFEFLDWQNYPARVSWPVRPAIRSTGLRKLLFSKKKLHKQAHMSLFYQNQKKRQDSLYFSMESNSISWLLHLTTPNLPSREVGFRVSFGVFFRRRVSGPLSPMIPNKLPLPQWRNGLLQFLDVLQFNV